MMPDKENMDTSEPVMEKQDIVEQMKKATITLKDSDLPYEEDILKNPTSLRSWQRYIDHKKKTKAHWKQTCCLRESLEDFRTELQTLMFSKY